MAGSRQSLRLVPRESFASRLRDQRKLDDLTQAELGERFGVRQQTIGAWERGERPQSRFFGALAEYLGLAGERELASLIDSQPDLAADQDTANPLADEAVKSDVDPMRLLLRQFLRDQERGGLPPDKAADIYKDLIGYFKARGVDQ